MERNGSWDCRSNHNRAINPLLFSPVSKLFCLNKYWDDYFIKIKECLKVDGRAVVQTITIGDEFYKKYHYDLDIEKIISKMEVKKEKCCI